jgi:hypothetical protein
MSSPKASSMLLRTPLKVEAGPSGSLPASDRTCASAIRLQLRDRTEMAGCGTRREDVPPEHGGGHAEPVPSSRSHR